jgi:hypothetical protein
MLCFDIRQVDNNQYQTHPKPAKQSVCQWPTMNGFDQQHQFDEPKHSIPKGIRLVSCLTIGLHCVHQVIRVLHDICCVALCRTLQQNSQATEHAACHVFAVKYYSSYTHVLVLRFDRDCTPQVSWELNPCWQWQQHSKHNNIVCSHDSHVSMSASSTESHDMEHLSPSSRMASYWSGIVATCCAVMPSYQWIHQTDSPHHHHHHHHVYIQEDTCLAWQWAITHGYSEPHNNTVCLVCDVTHRCWMRYQDWLLYDSGMLVLTSRD